MLLELVGSRLPDLAPVLQLFADAFQAQIIAMHPDTWAALLEHYQLDPRLEVPAQVHVTEQCPAMEVLCLPYTQFVRLELMHEATHGTAGTPGDP